MNFATGRMYAKILEIERMRAERRQGEVRKAAHVWVAHGKTAGVWQTHTHTHVTKGR